MNFFDIQSATHTQKERERESERERVRVRERERAIHNVKERESVSESVE